MTPIKFRCSYYRCQWHGDETNVLDAPDPFNPGARLIACPACRQQTLQVCCDEPGCFEPATYGTPITNGYRRTCRAHIPKGKQ